MELIDPIELYTYPWDWHKGSREIAKKVRTGLYILKEDGFLRRGITTATTACAAMNAAIASLKSEIDEVEVLTPIGIKVKVEVEILERGFAKAKKFAGDHAFDVTNGIEITAKLDGESISFGRGIGSFRGRKSVSSSAMRQIIQNFKYYASKYDYKGGVVIEVPKGEKIAKKTKNEVLGIKGGISILGTTGFVEPWCKELVRTKIEIAKQYERIVITTGRKAWLYAFKKYYPKYQPFVFGVYIDEILKKHPGEKIIVGYPGLLSIWAGGLNKIKERASKYGVRRVEILKSYGLSNNVTEILNLS